MIIELRIKNCFSFSEQVVFSMKADMRSRRFPTNLINVDQQNILKVAGVYGPNNAGKTCLIKCIRSMRNILLGRNPQLMSNLFTHNHVCELGITFAHQNRFYSYDVKYDTKEMIFVYEEFAELTYDQYGNEKKTTWLYRDVDGQMFVSDSSELNDILSAFSKNNLICYLVDTSKFRQLEQIKKIINGFAQKIEIVNMNNIPMKKTIDLLKNHNDLQNKVVSFIKNADIYMEDYAYLDADKVSIEARLTELDPDEKVLDIPENVMDRIRLVSVYKGVPVPSLLFDSTGTKKIAAIASYVIEGLEEGKILVIDELDNSIHFKLTRAIVAMFNNELNTNTQLIFTVHDINLMDCKRMFRKEQIWFVHKDLDRVYLYPLSEFTAEQGIRDTTDIIEKYKKGVLGALPEPELINTLLNLKGNQQIEEDE